MPTINEAAPTPDISPPPEVVMDNVQPEVPTDHPEIDAAAITVGGLIKNCPHYAERFRVDPEGTKAEAEQITQRYQEDIAMREQGMSPKEIKAKMMADNLARAKEKAVAAERDQKPESPTQGKDAEHVEDTQHVIAKHKVATEEMLATKVDTPDDPGAEILYVVDELARLEQLAEQSANDVEENIELDTVSKPVGKPVVEINVKTVTEKVEVAAIAPSDNHEPDSTDTVDAAYPVEELLPQQPIALPEQIQLPIETSGEVSTEVETEIIEHEKKPEEIYDDFSIALESLLVQSSEQLDTELSEVGDVELITLDNTQESETYEAQNFEALPDIAITVSEKLAELEVGDKETVVLAVVDIMNTMHVIETLKSEDSEPEAIETAKAQLKELVVTLFEQLTIEYQEEDVEQFVAVLLRPAFLSKQQEMVEPTFVDLEHDGTHEAKFHLASAAASLFTDVEQTIEQLLGNLVLSSATERQTA